MATLQKCGNIWFRQNNPFEQIIEFMFLFSCLFIIGTLMYFGFCWLFDIKYTWKIYFIFDMLFSIGGYLTIKL